MAKKEQESGNRASAATEKTKSDQVDTSPKAIVEALLISTVLRSAFPSSGETFRDKTKRSTSFGKLARSVDAAYNGKKEDE